MGVSRGTDSLSPGCTPQIKKQTCVNLACQMTKSTRRVVGCEDQSGTHCKGVGCQVPQVPGVRQKNASNLVRAESNLVKRIRKRDLLSKRFVRALQEEGIRKHHCFEERRVPSKEASQARSHIVIIVRL